MLPAFLAARAQCKRVPLHRPHSPAGRQGTKYKAVGGNRYRAGLPLREWAAVQRLEMRPCRVQEAAVVRCRRAVLVMVHAHVSMDDALGAIRCEELLG